MEFDDEKTAEQTQEALQSMKDLHYLEQFEDLIITLSGRFVNVGSRDLDTEINHALQAIGRFFEVERSYVFQFSADHRRFSYTHEWCATGVKPMIGRLQDAPADQFPWILEQL